MCLDSPLTVPISLVRPPQPDENLTIQLAPVCPGCSSSRHVADNALHFGPAGLTKRTTVGSCQLCFSIVRAYLSGSAPDLLLIFHPKEYFLTSPLVFGCASGGGRRRLDSRGLALPEGS